MPASSGPVDSLATSTEITPSTQSRRTSPGDIVIWMMKAIARPEKMEEVTQHTLRRFWKIKAEKYYVDEKTVVAPYKLR